jgi:Mg2+/Co2+ transporter CorB
VVRYLLTRTGAVAHGLRDIAMNINWAPLQKAVDPIWKLITALFAEHNFLTILCAFLALMMTISFYRFLKGISPALVAFVLLLILAVLVMHWTVTRTEPAFLKPVIDFLAPFFPSVAPVPATPPVKH